MVKIKFYLNTHEIVREQNLASKGVYIHSIDLLENPLAGSMGEMLLLKLKLLNLELQNAQKTAELRTSDEYFYARKETLRLNKAKNNGFIICEYCKNICNDLNNNILRYTVDHVVPLSEGGNGTDQSNLKIACRFCNRIKGSMSEAEFLSYIKAGKREVALKYFELYIKQNNLIASHEVLSMFVQNYDKITKKLNKG